MYAIYAVGELGEFGSNEGNGLPWGSFPEELAAFYSGLVSLSKRIVLNGKKPALVASVKTYNGLPHPVIDRIQEHAGTSSWVLVGRDIPSVCTPGTQLVTQVSATFDGLLSDQGMTGICIGGARLLASLYGFGLIEGDLVSTVSKNSVVNNWTNKPNTRLILPSDVVYTPTKLLVKQYSGNKLSFKQHYGVY